MQFIIENFELKAAKDSKMCAKSSGAVLILQALEVFDSCDLLGLKGL